MYTGELMDANALVYLRARYYHPGLGVFTSLDPVEGVNRYQYVGGNVANMVDPGGMIGESPGLWDTCAHANETCFDCCEPYNVSQATYQECVNRCESGDYSMCFPGCKVEIAWYSLIEATIPQDSEFFSHSFIIFTDANGVETAFRGGQDIVPPHFDADLLYRYERHNTLVFGEQTVKYVYIGSRLDVDIHPAGTGDFVNLAKAGNHRISVPLANAGNCSEILSRLETETKRIDELGLPYCLYGPNSNTVARLLLKAALNTDDNLKTNNPLSFSRLPGWDSDLGWHDECTLGGGWINFEIQ